MKLAIVGSRGLDISQLSWLEPLVPKDCEAIVSGGAKGVEPVGLGDCPASGTGLHRIAAGLRAVRPRRPLDSGPGHCPGSGSGDGGVGRAPPGAPVM